MSAEYIPVDEMVASLQIDLGQSSAVMSPVIKRHIYRAMQQIGGMRMILKCAKIKIVHDTIPYIPKPADLVAPHHVYLIKDGKDGCVEPWYDDSLTCCRDECGNDPSSITKGNNKYTVADNILGNRYTFSTNITTDSFTHVRLHYYQAILDDNGMPVIPSFAFEAISAYVDYKWLKMTRNQFRRSKSKNNQVALSEYQDARTVWKHELIAAHGYICSPGSFRELLEVADDLLYRVPRTFPSTLRNYVSNYYGGCC